jgi:hypothetical protein
MAGSITLDDKAFVEEWEHISPQQWGIIRLDPRGDERHEVISGRRTFKITTEERIITEDRIRKDDDDPFLNGSFRPVVVPDSVNIESIPNALSDEEILQRRGRRKRGRRRDREPASPGWALERLPLVHRGSSWADASHESEGGGPCRPT